MKHRFAYLGTAVLAVAFALPAAAADYSKILTPARPGLPLADPIATSAIAPPPFSLVSDHPVNPAYVAGLPGLAQNRMVSDDFGRKIPKFDGVFIRQSRVENGEVVIPPGGLVYMEDTWGGEVALRGEIIPVLGRMSTYVDYNMSIEVKENVTIPAGGSVVVGGQVYNYYATVGHETMANHALAVRTIAGTDWEWAFGSPVLSENESGWWNNKFVQLYNQGQAREVNAQKMVFDWLSGVRMDRMLMADQKVFAGLAAKGDSWQVGGKTVRVTAVDTDAGTVTLDVLENGNVQSTRTLGPVRKDLLIEDTASRKALVFEDGDMVAFLSPWPNAFENGKANLKVYGKAYSLSYGQDYPRDSRFTVYPVGCPTGHGFGFMLVNKEEIRLKPGTSANGPEGYFKVVLDKLDGNAVTAWHMQDKGGARSINLGGPGVTNIDLVLGQGRIAGQAILKDVGRTMLARGYDTTARLEGVAAPALISSAAAATLTNPAPAEPTGLSPSMLIALAILVVVCAGLGFELGRRRKNR